MFRFALKTLLHDFRIESEQHQERNHAILETTNLILALLEQSYSECVSLNHKLEKRVMGLDE